MKKEWTDEFVELFVGGDIEVEKNYTVYKSYLDGLITNYTTLFTSKDCQIPWIRVHCDTHDGCQVFGDLDNQKWLNLRFEYYFYDELYDETFSTLVGNTNEAFLYNVEIHVPGEQELTKGLTPTLFASNMVNTTLFYFGLVFENFTMTQPKGAYVALEAEECQLYGVFVEGENVVLGSDFAYIVYGMSNSILMYSYIDMENLVSENTFSIGEANGVNTIGSYFMKIASHQTERSSAVANVCNGDIEVKDCFFDIHVDSEAASISYNLMNTISSDVSAVINSSFSKIYTNQNTTTINSFVSSSVSGDLQVSGYAFYTTGVVTGEVEIDGGKYEVEASYVIGGYSYSSSNQGFNSVSSTDEMEGWKFASAGDVSSLYMENMPYVEGNVLYDNKEAFMAVGLKWEGGKRVCVGYGSGGAGSWWYMWSNLVYNIQWDYKLLRYITMRVRIPGNLCGDVKVLVDHKCVLWQGPSLAAGEDLRMDFDLAKCIPNLNLKHTISVEFTCMNKDYEYDYEMWTGTDCSIGHGGCHSTAICNDMSNGHARCTCGVGKTGNGYTGCVDITYPVEYSCNNKTDGFYCYPESCCPYLLYCHDNYGSIQSTAAGSVCKDDMIVDDDCCEGINCPLGDVRCGDGICSVIEMGHCPEDCGVISCGDGMCSYTENCYDCPDDCGICADVLPPVEGDCPADNMCDRNAQCILLFNGYQQCICRAGYVGNGAECHRHVGCEDRANGEYCYTENCCPKHYSCYDHRVLSVGIFTNENTVCYDGQEVWANGDECKDVNPICNYDTCGNDVCDVDETCLTCPHDCGECVVCGDNVCSEGESCINCPNDCGRCNGNDGPDGPCADNNGGCDENAYCSVNCNSTVVCSCKEGYYGNGATCRQIVYPEGITCADKVDGAYCFTDNCCPYFYYCINKVPSVVRENANGTVCHNGYQISADDTLCSDKDTVCEQEASCGDGICQYIEILTCPEDCGSVECGDGVCSGTETFITCPEDCGECEESHSCIGICGNGCDCEKPTGLVGACADNYGGCDENAECIPLSNGKAQCICHAGFVGNGQSCRRKFVCDGDSDNICAPHDCCSKFYQCSNGVPSELMDVAEGTVCYGGELIYPNDLLCANVEVDCSFNHNDGICDLDENCETYPSECGGCISCGDGICSAGETCKDCPEDCGICSGNAESDDSQNNGNASTSKNTKNIIYAVIGCACGFAAVAVVLGVVALKRKKAYHSTETQEI